MSNPLQSQGFGVNVMPNVQLANPQAFNSYGAFGGGISQGLDIGAKLQAIQAQRDRMAYDNEIRPLNRQLMDVQIANAQRSGALADIKFPGEATLARQPIEKKEGTYMDYDENGNLVEYQTTKEIDPMTGKETTYTGQPIRTVKTADQIEEEKKNNEAMRGYRTSMGAGSAQRAATAAQIAAWKQANPTVKTRQIYDADNNVYEQPINPDGTAGEPWQVMTPDGKAAKRPQMQNTFQLLMNGGGDAGAPGAAAAGTPSPAGGDPLDALTKSFSVAPAAPAVGGPTKVFASEAEAEAAANAVPPQIQSGDKIVIAGRPGTWH